MLVLNCLGDGEVEEVRSGRGWRGGGSDEWKGGGEVEEVRGGSRWRGRGSEKWKGVEG